MKTPTIYVILHGDGEAYVVKNKGPKSTQKVDINELLDEGWRPISETTFGTGTVLVRLEREPDGQLGFGFGH